jgi:hypothetical protein
MQTKHAQEMQQIQRALSEGQNDSKKKLTEQHNAQTKTLKKEAAANLAKEMECVRQEAQTQASKQAEVQVEKILMTMNMQGKEHEEELRRLRTEATNQVNALQQQLKSAANSTGGVSSALEASENRRERHIEDIEHSSEATVVPDGSVSGSVVSVGC